MERQATDHPASHHRGAAAGGRTDGGVLTRGLIAGFLGATAVALWFLVVDVLGGRVFYTPEVLGRGVLSIFGSTEGDARMTAVIVFTIVHYGAFFVIGIIAAAILRAAERQPSVLAGALILFVAFEVAFYGFTAVMAETAAFSGNLAWYQIGLSNLVAAIVMGLYLWRSSPALGRRVDHALQGRE